MPRSHKQVATICRGRSWQVPKSFWVSNHFVPKPWASHLQKLGTHHLPPPTTVVNKIPPKNPNQQSSLHRWPLERSTTRFVDDCQGFQRFQIHKQTSQANLFKANFFILCLLGIHFLPPSKAWSTARIHGTNDSPKEQIKVYQIILGREYDDRIIEGSLEV